jgi:transcriptional regulator with XRE-family HTH domain
MINLKKQVPYPNRIRAIRKALGMTQADVAKLVGFSSEDRICRWEQGVAVPRPVNLFKLAQALHVRLDELYPEFVAGKIND